MNQHNIKQNNSILSGGMLPLNQMKLSSNEIEGVTALPIMVEGIITAVITMYLAIKMTNVRKNSEGRLQLTSAVIST